MWLSPARKAEVVASPDRNDADRTHALHRRPEQMLAFIGIRPGMMALDINAGGGYTTELLARSAGPLGRVYGQVDDRSSHRLQRTSSTGVEQAASTRVATDPSTMLPRLLWPCEPMTSRSNLPFSAAFAIKSAGWPTLWT